MVQVADDSLLVRAGLEPVCSPEYLQKGVPSTDCRLWRVRFKLMAGKQRSRMGCGI